MSDWFALGLATIGSVTGVVLSSLALQAEPNTKDLGDCIFDLFVSRRISARRYFRKRTSDPSISSTTFESVGNTLFEEEDPVAAPTRFSGRDHVLVAKRGFAVKPSPTQLIENANNISLQSSNPINFRSHTLFLNNQLVTPSVSPTGLKGEQGEQGPQGDQGDSGLKGVKGDPGSKGSKGQFGNQGPLGEDGKDGKDGLKGEKGINGPAGMTGLLGQTFDFFKIWPDQATKDADEAKDPRPSDFPPAGHYGLVSDDGKVYLSDGLNLTQVDDISEQGMHGEKGEKGEKGNKGDPGQQGLQPAPGPKGDLGLKGFEGQPGTTKGEKGSPSTEDGGDGDPGERGDVGPTGNRGPKGDFSMLGFDDITRPVLTTIIQGTPRENYTLEVENPVYSLPVRVYALVVTPGQTPTAQDIVDNGELILVPVDANGQGNALYVNTSPDNLWFTWVDNDRDPQQPIGPFIGPDLAFSVTSQEPATYELFIDGKFESSISVPGGPEPVSFPFVASLGQSYLIQWVDPNDNSFYCEPSTTEGDVAEGTVGGPVNVVFDCYPLESLGGTLISNTSRTIFVTIDTPGGNTFFDSVSSNGGSFVFPQLFPRFSSYNVSILGLGPDVCVGAIGVITAGGVNDLLIGCNFGRLIMNFNQGGRRSFTLLVNGSNVGTYDLFSGQAIPEVIAPGATWQVIPDPADSPNVPSRTGTMPSSDLQVNFTYPPRPYRVQVTTEGVQGGVNTATYELTLNSFSPETEVKVFSGGNGYFDTRASTGDQYRVRFISVDPIDPFQANCDDKTSSASAVVAGPIRDPLTGTVGTRDVDIAVRPCGNDPNIPI